MQAKVIFQAVAVDEFNRPYDASFSVETTGEVTQQEFQAAVNGAVQQFLQYHPSGRIVNQTVMQH